MIYLTPRVHGLRLKLRQPELKTTPTSGVCGAMEEPGSEATLGERSLGERSLEESSLDERSREESSLDERSSPMMRRRSSSLHLKRRLSRSGSFSQKNALVPPSTTILDTFRRQVSDWPEHRLFTWVDSRCREQNTLTCAGLWSAAGAVCEMLIENGCEPGDRVMIAYTPGLDFLAGIVGCMRAGVIACSVYPPNPRQLTAELEKFSMFAADAGAQFALTTSRLLYLLRAAKSWLSSTFAGVTWLATDTLSCSAPPRHADYKPVASDVAFIQYTSGSTGKPKVNQAHPCRIHVRHA